MKRAAFTVAMITALAGCGDDDSGAIDAQVIDAQVIDAAIDAPPGPCGADLQITGQYIDWDSTTASFDGVEDAVWTVVTPAGGAMATTAPNGRILLCIKRDQTSQIDIIQPNYLPARFVADGPVFAQPGALFTVRGLRAGMGPAQFGELGESFDAAAAQVLVYKVGAPIPLALSPATNPAQHSYVSDGEDDVTWTSGATGALTLFPNRPVGAGTATLTSTSNFIGAATLPLAAGRFTLVVIR